MEIKTSFSEREICICINSILKTSPFYKNIPQEQRGQLILFLKEKYFPHLTNEEIRSIEQAIIDQSGTVMSDLMKYGIQVLGVGQLNKAFAKFGKLVGKEKAQKVQELLNQKAKEGME